MTHIFTVILLLGQVSPGEPPDPLGGASKPAANTAEDLLKDPAPTAAPNAGDGVPGKPQDFQPAGNTGEAPAANAGAAPAGSPAAGGDAAAASGETESAGGKSFSDWWDDVSSTGAMGLMRRGGFFMWPILILGIIAFGVILERYRSLKLLTTDSSALRSQVRTLLQSDRIEEAHELCEREQGPVSAILGAGIRKFMLLRRLNYDPGKIQEQVVKAMDDYGVHIVAALERHLPVLGTVSSVAPMLGFLGTVSGMITSFDEIVASLGEKNIVEAAAGGIAVALITTMAGLVVGIPAYMAFNYFTSVINGFVLDVEESASELIELVTLQMTIENREQETV